MINGIRYFEGECIKKFEKLENDFMKAPTKLTEYMVAITEEVHNLGLRMIQESLESMNEMLRNSEVHKQNLVVESHATKQLITDPL